MTDLFEDVWREQSTATIEDAAELTLRVSYSILQYMTRTDTMQMSLLIIGIAGFGQELSWKEDSIIPPGHKVSFKVSLVTE